MLLSPGADIRMTMSAVTQGWPNEKGALKSYL